MAVDYPGNILTSSDGITWNSIASGTSNSLYAITFGKGLFVTAGTEGTILTSSDGISWTERNSGTTTAIYKIAYGGNQFA